MTKFSKASQFGMTFKPLTEDLGEALLMSYREAFRAKISQSQEEAQGSKAIDPPCGDIWQGSSMKYDPDTFSWKTLQCSLPEASTKSSATLPRSGMTLGGRLWVLPMLEPRTKEKGFGWWRTPDTGAGGTSGLLKQGITHRPNGQPIQIRLVDQVNNPHLWATPTVMDHLPIRNEEALKRQYDKNRAGRTSHSTLREQVVYPPPKQMWPTPQASDNRDRGNMSNPCIQRRVAMGKQIMLSQSVDPTSGQLNPTWVEWLMGWPAGWSDLKPLETDKFPCVPPKLGDI
jgi:DNA (cytosine-5)-methyltransferase 1